MAPIIRSLRLFALSAFLVHAVPAGVQAQACLSLGEARAAVQSGQAVSFNKRQVEAATGGKIIGVPSLCGSAGNLYYSVNVQWANGSVATIRVNARTGAVSGR